MVARSHELFAGGRLPHGCWRHRWLGKGGLQGEGSEVGQLRLGMILQFERKGSFQESMKAGLSQT